MILMDETGFVERLKDGEEKAWEELVNEYSPKLFAYFNYHLGGTDHSVCEDLIQDTFASVVQAIARFDTRYSISQFVFGIARNRLIDYLRKRKHRETLLPPTPPDDSSRGSSLFMYMSAMKSDRRTPAESAVAMEESRRRRAALAQAMRELVEKLWEKEEFEQLKVLEFLLVMGGRNKEAAEMFNVGSERAVAGIKFRALDMIKQGLKARDPSRTLFPGLWA